MTLHLREHMDTDELPFRVAVGACLYFFQLGQTWKDTCSAGGLSLYHLTSLVKKQIPLVCLSHLHLKQKNQQGNTK